MDGPSSSSSSFPSSSSFLPSLSSTSLPSFASPSTTTTTNKSIPIPLPLQIKMQMSIPPSMPVPAAISKHSLGTALPDLNTAILNSLPPTSYPSFHLSSQGFLSNITTHSTIPTPSISTSIITSNKSSFETPAALVNQVNRNQNDSFNLEHTNDHQNNTNDDKENRNVNPDNNSNNDNDNIPPISTTTTTTNSDLTLSDDKEKRIHDALEEYKTGNSNSIRHLSSKYNIPRSTLRDRIKRANLSNNNVSGEERRAVILKSRAKNVIDRQLRDIKHRERDALIKAALDYYHSSENDGSKQGVRALSAKFGIPRSTLRGRLQGSISSRARVQKDQKLSLDEEDTLVLWIKKACGAGEEVTPSRIRNMANILQQYRPANTSSSDNEQEDNNNINTTSDLEPKFTDPATDRKNQVCLGWVRGFLGRHPSLIDANGIILNVKKATSFRKHKFHEWFQLICEKTTVRHIPPENIFIAGYASFFVSQVIVDGKRQVSPSDFLPPYLHTSPQLEPLFSLECFSCDLESISPFIILNEGTEYFKNIPKEVSDWSFNYSPHEKLTKSLVFKWLSQWFGPNTKKSSSPHHRRILIGEESWTENNPEFVKYCELNDIDFLGLPPFTFHELLPLTLGVFGKIKRNLCIRIESSLKSPLSQDSISDNEHDLTVPPNCISGTEWLRHFNHARIQGMTKSILSRTLRQSGLWPLDPHLVINRIWNATPETDIPYGSTLLPALENLNRINNIPLSPSNSITTENDNSSETIDTGTEDRIYSSSTSSSTCTSPPTTEHNEFNQNHLPNRPDLICINNSTNNNLSSILNFEEQLNPSANFAPSVSTASPDTHVLSSPSCSLTTNSISNLINHSPVAQTMEIKPQENKRHLSSVDGTDLNTLGDKRVKLSSLRDILQNDSTSDTVALPSSESFSADGLNDSSMSSSLPFSSSSLSSRQMNLASIEPSIIASSRQQSSLGHNFQLPSLPVALNNPLPVQMVPPISSKSHLIPGGTTVGPSLSSLQQQQQQANLQNLYTAGNQFNLSNPQFAPLPSLSDTLSQPASLQRGPVEFPEPHSSFPPDRLVSGISSSKSIPNSTSSLLVDLPSTQNSLKSSCLNISGTSRPADTTSISMPPPSSSSIPLNTTTATTTTTIATIDNLLNSSSSNSALPSLYSLNLISSIPSHSFQSLLTNPPPLNTKDNDEKSIVNIAVDSNNNNNNNTAI